MASFEALEAFYHEMQGNGPHYLFDMRREPEGWQEEQQCGRGGGGV